MAMSMTGFGRGESSAFGKKVVIELKSVNHRFLEIYFRVPRGFTALEEYLRPLLKEKLHRGRVEVYVNIEDEGEKKRNVKLDKALAIAYANSLKELADTMNISYNISLQDLASFPDVLKPEEEETLADDFYQTVAAAMKQALSDLLAMRSLEGGRLLEDLLQKNRFVSVIVDDIAARAPDIVENYRQRLMQRVQELSGDQLVEEQRIAQEVAIFADHSNIDEELVRLKSHIKSMAGELKHSREPIGRKLDFLIQEVNREFNTIGAKANDLEIAKKVVEAKSEVEKMREQVQNIE